MKAYALASRPLRYLVLRDPILALQCSAVAGLAIGGMLTFVAFRVGPEDIWSGPLVGLVFGLAWFWVARKSALGAAAVAA